MKKYSTVISYEDFNYLFDSFKLAGEEGWVIPILHWIQFQLSL